jgi:hypothetical protein
VANSCESNKDHAVGEPCKWPFVEIWEREERINVENQRKMKQNEYKDTNDQAIDGFALQRKEWA